MVTGASLMLSNFTDYGQEIKYIYCEQKLLNETAFFLMAKMNFLLWERKKVCELGEISY